MSQANRMFPERIFSVKNPSNGEQEWYFLTREEIIGPYETEEVAKHAVNEFVHWFKALKLTGGRNEATASKAELQAMEHMRRYH